MRVTIQHGDGDGIAMKIEGKIAGPNVAALCQAWLDLAPSLGPGKLVVDIRGVRHVDEAGVNLLAEIHEKTGAEFVADTPLTKYFAEEAQHGIRTRTAFKLGRQS
jgi:anti-anti-sigma regulatory factor